MAGHCGCELHLVNPDNLFSVRNGRRYLLPLISGNYHEIRKEECISLFWWNTCPPECLFDRCQIFNRRSVYCNADFNCFICVSSDACLFLKECLCNINTVQGILIIITATAAIFAVPEKERRFFINSQSHASAGGISHIAIRGFRPQR